QTLPALTAALRLPPPLLAAQPPSTPAPTPPPPGLLSYRGFRPGVSAAEFSNRARTLTRAGSTPLVCNTSTRTAQVMECGVVIRDPDDGAEFYLSGHFIDG